MSRVDTPTKSLLGAAPGWDGTDPGSAPLWGRLPGLRAAGPWLTLLLTLLVRSISSELGHPPSSSHSPASLSPLGTAPKQEEVLTLNPAPSSTFGQNGDSRTLLSPRDTQQHPQPPSPAPGDRSAPWRLGKAGPGGGQGPAGPVPGVIGRHRPDRHGWHRPAA